MHLLEIIVAEVIDRSNIDITVQPCDFDFWNSAYIYKGGVQSMRLYLVDQHIVLVINYESLSRSLELDLNDPNVDIVEKIIESLKR